MVPAELTATLVHMTDPEQTAAGRFAALDARREELGVSIERLYRRAGYKSAQSWYDLRDGKRPVATLEKFERALDYIEEHADEVGEVSAVSSTAEGLLEIEVPDLEGHVIVVRGSSANPEAIARAAAEIMRNMRAGQQDQGGE